MYINTRIDKEKICCELQLSWKWLDDLLAIYDDRYCCITDAGICCLPEDSVAVKYPMYVVKRPHIDNPEFIGQLLKLFPPKYHVVIEPLYIEIYYLVGQ